MIEIERKWLVPTLPDLTGVKHKSIVQGYLSLEPLVRVSIADGEAAICIKGKGLLSRLEVEPLIKVEEATALLELARGLIIKKTRYYIPTGDTLVIELDVYHNEELQGLYVAEIELPSEDTVITLPQWFGAEITYYSELKNGSMSENPGRAMATVINVR